jgi:hypothetical protein
MGNATYTFDTDTFSDLHKDALGFRPHSGFWHWLKSATDDERQAEWDSLIVALETREQQRQEAQRAATVRFETLVAKTQAVGARTREDAIRWLMEGESDVGYFEYLMGIPYGYVNKRQ